MNSAPTKLIYIAGYGRSGTTLLDIALGQHEALFGAGEITAFSRHVLQQGDFCACGDQVSRCSLWGDVATQWLRGEKATALEDYRNAQEKTETLLSSWRMLFGFEGRARREYTRLTAKLVDTIAALSGCSAIIDSSKLPGRAAAMASLPGITLYVVHVVRDGRGVAWSLMKPYSRQPESGVQRDLKPKPLLYTALRWTVVNLVTEVICWKLGPRRSIRVRYEDFVSDPAGSLRQITEMVRDDKIGAHPHVNGSPVFPGHQVAGSRHRMQKTLGFRIDAGWQREMPAARQALFSLIAGPLMRRYGYQPRAAGALSPATESMS